MSYFFLCWRSLKHACTAAQVQRLLLDGCLVYRAIAWRWTLISKFDPWINFIKCIYSCRICEKFDGQKFDEELLAPSLDRCTHGFWGGILTWNRSSRLCLTRSIARYLVTTRILMLERSKCSYPDREGATPKCTCFWYLRTAGLQDKFSVLTGDIWKVSHWAVNLKKTLPCPPKKGKASSDLWRLHNAFSAAAGFPWGRLPISMQSPLPQSTSTDLEQRHLYWLEDAHVSLLDDSTTLSAFGRPANVTDQCVLLKLGKANQASTGWTGSCTHASTHCYLLISLQKWYFHDQASCLLRREA